MTKSIIVVDVQNDFVTGSLAVAGASAIIPNINKLMKIFGNEDTMIVFTMDSHPSKTAHFDKWPQHCIDGTEGAYLVSELNFPAGSKIVRKGLGTLDDGYSGFDNTNLANMLRDNGIDTVYVCGIATDYCVKATVMDALKEGFIVNLVTNACVAVNQADGNIAIKQMVASGANLVNV